MGKFFNKIRQVFNIFLIMLLIGLAAAVFVYFLTTPEQRGVTFWISVGFLIFALILETLMFSGIAMRGDSGRKIPSGFSQVLLCGLYFLFVIIVSVWNAFANFTVIKYMLIHIGGLVVFLVPMMLINMAVLRMSGADRREQKEGRANLSSMANKVAYIAEDLKSTGTPAESVAAIVNLSELIRYSDPTPAKSKIERDFEDSINNLVKISESKDLDAILRACTLAERALKERNESVRNSK